MPGSRNSLPTAWNGYVEDAEEVLSRMGLSGEPELKELLDLFRTRQQIDFVVIDNDLHAVKADPADGKFLECALKARAACIVSGDKCEIILLDIGSHGERCR